MEALPKKARQFMTRQDWVVLDTETTGRDANAPETEIVEIVIVAHDGTVLLNSLVKPEKPIPPEVICIHGITDEMVKDAPSFTELFPKIDALLKGKVCIVYNAGYDIALIENLAERHGFGFWAVENWCLMKAYADYYKAPGRWRGSGYAWQSLTSACKQQRVTLTEAHRALGDTLATWSLLKTLAERQEG